MMKAHKILSDGCYSSDQLKILTKVFDDAWDQIANSVGTHPTTVKAARLKLADIVLYLHDTDSQDAARMTQLAVKGMLAPATQV